MRKRTPKDGRPLTKTKESELFRSPREPAASESKVSDASEMGQELSQHQIYVGQLKEALKIRGVKVKGNDLFKFF